MVGCAKYDGQMLKIGLESKPLQRLIKVASEHTIPLLQPCGWEHLNKNKETTMSLQLIRTFHPVAHKDYTCCLCGFTIKKETSYVRRRCYYGRIYDCVCHNECERITRELDMFDNVGYELLDSHTFCEIVFDAANDMGVFEASKTDYQLVLDILREIDAPIRKD